MVDTKIFKDIKGIQLRCKILKSDKSDKYHKITITEATETLGLNSNDMIDVIIPIPEGITLATEQDIRDKKTQVVQKSFLEFNEKLRFNIFAEIIGDGVGTSDAGHPEICSDLDNLRIYTDIINRLYAKEIYNYDEKEKILDEIHKLNPNFPDIELNSPSLDLINLEKIYSNLSIRDKEDNELLEAIKKKYPNVKNALIRGAIYDFKNDITRNALKGKQEPFIRHNFKVIKANKNYLQDNSNK